MQSRNAERLLDTPGIVGTGVGLNPAGHPVIRIYTEQEDAQGVPDSLEGIAVERVTTGQIRVRAPTDRFPRPVPIGVSSGHLNTATGTLGARVTDGVNVFALSNNHVYAANNSGAIGDGIIQPGNVDGGSDPADRIGTLHDYEPINFNDGATNTMDAAIALSSTADVGTETPADGYGAPNPVTTPAYVGQPVQKYGRTTGFQLGTVVEINVTVDVCYVWFFTCFEDARFVNQVSITPEAFSAGGDSGSLIVSQHAKQPVALLFAGGEGRTIGNPIDAVLQRFGVTIDGTVPPVGTPGAPTGLAASAGDGNVSLSWQAPTFDGGSALTAYRIYRGTSAGGETFLTSVGPGATSYEDTAVTNGTTYYYKVSAESSVGEGPQSNEASATPASLAPPAEPLPTLDDFNRGSENPLSDGGKWSNGINGSAETGLYVTSNTLACSKTTTCTGWRSNAQYGPDSEAWIRVPTLPGNGNAVRLYTRLKEPGSTAVDGYMALWNQASGTDTVTVYRITNNGLTALGTANDEFGAGHTLLFRAAGSTLEAWRHDGSAWSRALTVADTTHAGPGFVGVGLRGTSGRLDDAGGRTSGISPPGAPTGLAASAGDGSVSLSWQAPIADGGSPLTAYRIHRGTSSGGETFLTSVGPGATSYSDTAVANGTTYYYKVSAENAVGEGPQSNEASATPSGAVPPAEPLPTLDGFNRPDENPLSDGGKWSNGINGSIETGLYLTSNTLACSKTTTCTGWRSNAQYGPESETWIRVATLPGNGNAVRLYARVQEPGSTAVDGYMALWNQASGTDTVTVYRMTNNGLAALGTANDEFGAGHTLLLRAEGSTLEAWRHDGSVWSRALTVADSTHAGAGYVGVGLRGTIGRLDDSGGRTMGAPPPPPDPPGAPTSLTAEPSDGSVSLAWQAPASNGGSPLTGYRIYRGTDPASLSVLADIGATTSYQDAAVTNGTTYYYKVSAKNAVGEGPLSNEASATPIGAVSPDEPLTTLDGFNRPDENPLSDGGKWSNGINGSIETGLYVTSNTLACSKTTTCTGWRSNAQYGPDSEAWVRVPTLPGNGNAVRLYVRLQEPGSSAVDGYMALWNQASGTDTVTVYRITNDALTALGTANDEFGAGHTLLFRAEGSTLEAWRHDGSVWSRAFFVADATHAAAGYVGVGLRGTSGRLDDAGGRTMGVAPPPPEAPGAPTALAAQASDGTVSLSWQAPASDGGSPLTGYRIHRGTTSGGEAWLADVGVVTSYQDTTVTNGTTYYYKVSAVNAVGEGLLSNEASATPSGLVPPSEPLPVVDNFNRPNERPLSDAGRWTNGIIGASERNMKVASNRLASDRSTTATAWRNNLTYGPNSESWATITTLPGNGNAVRLYLRVQQPGSSAADGYMLLWSQASGTDTVDFYRLTNGSLTLLHSASREVAVGNALLFRATGSTLEAWVKAGGTWARAGEVTDTTYTGSGYAGVGIRGKTGRVDDFGARTLP